MTSPWRSLVLLIHLINSANTLPSEKASSNPRRATPQANPILLTAAANVSEPLTLHLNTTATNQDPICFTSAWLPLIDLEDCMYAMDELEDDQIAEAPFRQPIEWNAPHSWSVGTCDILLVQNTKQSKDTFARIEIARKALRIWDVCEHDPHGLRGGYTQIGEKDFRVAVRRPLPSIGTAALTESK